MLTSVLTDRSYAKLFAAQVVALLGTGLLTIALGLFAFDVAGSDAGQVLGVALTIKMVAYVGLSPVVEVLTDRVPRKMILIAADLIRAAAAISLPWISEVWQIYVLVFVLQAASAAFTPTFQAVIPDILPDEEEYTKALSLSRLAYDLEAVLSPVAAGALLAVMTYHDLFVGTCVGFLASMMLVCSTGVPSRGSDSRVERSFRERLMRGSRLFIANMELRGLLAVNLTVAAVVSMVLVNSVVVVKSDLGRSEGDLAVLLAVYGAGSMAVALGMPALVRRVSDRTVIAAGARVAPAALLVVAVVLEGVGGDVRWWMLAAVWFGLGIVSSLIGTPTARLLRRNSDQSNRTSVFAAQFSLSHACFVLTYLTAGLVGSRAGTGYAALVLAGIGVAATAVTLRVWRQVDESARIESPR